MNKIELFLQVEGLRRIELIHVSKEGTVQSIIDTARSKGLAKGEEPLIVFLEDGEEKLDPGMSLEAAGIVHRKRVHVHRCHKIRVTVNYQNQSRNHEFSPATTVGRVKKWAVSEKVFNLSEMDASEHLLQICGTNERPDEDAHLGSLVAFPACEICFDLVAKVRVEG
jgi:hypothetical protein